MMRTIGLTLLFVVGMLIAAALFAIPFLWSLIRGARAVHAHGTICNAELTALDDAGARLAGPARVRLSSSTGEENSASGILGIAIKVGTDQDLAAGTFESFAKVNDGTRNTDVADYLANQYASVAPWRIRGLGVVWLRAIPVPEASASKTGTRVERLDAAIAAGRAKLVLEARDAPGPDGPVRSRLVELRLTERLADDDPKFNISMFRTGRGISPTGFRNGVRAVVYPVSRFARGLRGG
jgi:hypothetical protein